MDFWKERCEAIAAGERALNSLHKARRHISTAKCFGIWDILGGGSYVSLFKHYKIERARKALERVRWDLDVFTRELRDIQMDLYVDIGLFLTVFDLMDNWIADIWVQCRLSDAGRRIDDVICKVEECLDRLSQHYN